MFKWQGHERGIDRPIDDLFGKLFCVSEGRSNASVRLLRILASWSNTVGSIGVPSEKQAISSEAFLRPASMR